MVQLALQINKTALNSNRIALNISYLNIDVLVTNTRYMSRHVAFSLFLITLI